MRKSKTIERMRSGDIIKACVLGHFIPAYVAHAANAGYDCIWLDLENRSISQRDVEYLLLASHRFDIDIMLRPPTIGKTQLYRYLEDGAAGLMIPHVSTPELAEQLVQAVKFPPIGDRGIDNAGLDADFHIHDPDTYAQWANQETFLCVQIETPEAVRRIDEIVAIKGIDMVFVGPGDLGLRLRQSGEMTLDEAWERVSSACRKSNMPFGGPTLGIEEMKKRRQQGAQFLVHCSEFQAFTSSLASNVVNFRELS